MNVFRWSLSPLFLLTAVALPACQPVPVAQLKQTAQFHVPKAVPLEPQHPLEIDIPGLTNFGFITPDIWRGGEPTPAGISVLAGMGVKTIIDLREGDESADIPAKIRYVRIPVSAFHADHVDTAKVLATIANNPKPIFIHCREGRDRTGLAIAAYRLSQGMSAEDACRELRNFRVNVWWQGPIERRVYQLARGTLALQQEIEPQDAETRR